MLLGSRLSRVSRVSTVQPDMAVVTEDPGFGNQDGLGVAVLLLVSTWKRSSRFSMWADKPPRQPSG